MAGKAEWGVTEWTASACGASLIVVSLIRRLETRSDGQVFSIPVESPTLSSSFRMCDTPVPPSQTGAVSGVLLEAAAEAVENTNGEADKAPAYKGVYEKGTNRFQVHAGRGEKRVCLGMFDTVEEAARAYDAHARSLGDKAVNFSNAEAGEVKVVMGETNEATLKRAAGGAASGGATASSARKKRAAPAAGAAAAPSPAAPPPAKQPPKAPGAKAAIPRPPPHFRGPPSSAGPQPTHPSPPPPPPQQQTQSQPQQRTLPPPPPALLPPLPPTGGHAAPLQLPPPPGASPEEAFIASLSLADPAGVLDHMSAKNIMLSHLVDAMRPGVADDMRQELWRDLFAELGVVDVGERIAMRFALARMQQ